MNRRLEAYILYYLYILLIYNPLTKKLLIQEIPSSKEITDNYWALGLLFESKICNNIYL